MSLHRTKSLALILLCSAPLVPLQAQVQDLPPLPVMLQRLSQVARLYRDNALHFTCDETITYRGTGGKRSHALEYIYVYTDDGELADSRVFRKRADKARAPADLDSLDLPRYLVRAYSWAFIFEASRRDRYAYELAGQEIIDGTSAVRIRFEPVPPFVEGINEWFGTAWVDLESYQLLRVEAMPLLDHRKQQRLRRLQRETEDSPRVSYSMDEIWRVVTEFGLLKNGMRFPTKVTFSASGYVVSGRKRGSHLREVPIAEVRQSYDNYRFFGVRTREEVDGLVFSTDRPAPAGGDSRTDRSSKP